MILKVLQSPPPAGDPISVIVGAGGQKSKVFARSRRHGGCVLTLDHVSRRTYGQKSVEEIVIRLADRSGSGHQDRWAVSHGYTTARRQVLRLTTGETRSCSRSPGSPRDGFDNWPGPEGLAIGASLAPRPCSSHGPGAANGAEITAFHLGGHRPRSGPDRVLRGELVGEQPGPKAPSVLPRSLDGITADKRGNFEAHS
jgi:hypothetical protein